MELHCGNFSTGLATGNGAIVNELPLFMFLLTVSCWLFLGDFVWSLRSSSHGFWRSIMGSRARNGQTVTLRLSEADSLGTSITARNPCDADASSQWSAMAIETTKDGEFSDSLLLTGAHADRIQQLCAPREESSVCGEKQRRNRGRAVFAGGPTASKLDAESDPSRTDACGRVASARLRAVATNDARFKNSALKGADAESIHQPCAPREAASVSDCNDAEKQSLTISEALHAGGSSCGIASELDADSTDTKRAALPQAAVSAIASLPSEVQPGSNRMTTPNVRVDAKKKILLGYYVCLNLIQRANAQELTRNGKPVESAAWEKSDVAKVVAMTLLAGVVGSVFLFCSRRTFSVNDINEGLMAGPARVHRGDPVFAILPRIEEEERRSPFCTLRRRLKLYKQD